MAPRPPRASHYAGDSGPRIATFRAGIGLVWKSFFEGSSGIRLFSGVSQRGDVLRGINRVYRAYAGPGTRGLTPTVVGRRTPGWAAGPPIG
jgi:hypothetical protein